MNTASAPATAAARSVVKKSRPDAILAATSAPSPGSKIGTSPRCSRAIFAASWSTQATVDPNSEKHAPETRPTYPVPTIAIRIRSTSFAQGKGSNPRWFSAVGSKPIYYRIRYVETSRALAVRLPVKAIFLDPYDLLQASQPICYSSIRLPYMTAPRVTLDG